MNRRYAVRTICLMLLRQDWPGILFTFIFALYMGATSSAAVNVYVGREQGFGVFSVTIDILFMAILPMFGLVLNKTVFAIWRNDPFTKRLAHLRSMPIPAQAIVMARFVQYFVLMAINGSVFFILLYVFTPNLRSEYSLLQWAGALAIWFCYGLVLNVFYAWLELGEDGKRYVKIYTAYMTAVMLVSALISIQGFHIFGWVVGQTSRPGYPWLLAGMVALALSASVAGYYGIANRVRRRAFFF